jgi:drug/metabolite transporter (DMT)-like permease
MEYVFLVLVIIGVYVQNIFQKQYNQKLEDNKDAGIIFSFLMVLSAMVVLGIVYIFQFSFRLETVLYALVFSIAFCVTVFAQVMAIKTGLLSLTALFCAFSLMLPTLYGLIFLQEKISWLGYIGIALLCVSLLLVNKVDGEKINKKWLFFAVLMLVGNGLCGIIQKVHQINIEGNYSVCFQFFAMLFASIGMGIIILFAKPKKVDEVLKEGLGYAGVTGGVNAGVNLLMLTLNKTMPAAILNPSVSAGGIVLTFITAMAFYKERFSKAQYLGYACGVLAVVLLSL